MGDSKKVLQLIPKNFQADLVFSCPPYADLEVYSDDPRDISTMAYPDFMTTYAKIINRCCQTLKENAFAAWVIGEVRDKKAPHKPYLGFVQDTITAFKNAGLQYYNEAVLVTAVGSLPIRTRCAFQSTRKLGRTHQNILIFVKGDPRKAAKLINPHTSTEETDDENCT